VRPESADDDLDRLERAVIEHEARSATRELMMRCVDAQDRGDVDDYVDCFDDDAVSETEGHIARGLSAIRDAFAIGCAQEPWRLHFVSNEQIVAGPSIARGSWIAFAISRTRGPEAAAYASLDVSIEAMPRGADWRVTKLQTALRFRCPYKAGWLHQRQLQLPRMSVRAPAERADQPRGMLRDQTSADLATRVQRLVDEATVRRLAAALASGFDRGQPGADLARAWTADGRYDATRTDEPASSSVGHAAIGQALDAERAATPTWIRCETNQRATVSGDDASCRWRELATAVRFGHEPWWVANAYDADLRRRDGTWRFVTVRREPLLACRYADGPPSAIRE
jgi:hypothetical protein